MNHHNGQIGSVCLDVVKTPVATLGTLLFVILSKVLVALATLAFSALFATAASKALAHCCVVRTLIQPCVKVAG